MVGLAFLAASRSFCRRACFASWSSSKGVFGWAFLRGDRAPLELVFGRGLTGAVTGRLAMRKAPQRRSRETTTYNIYLSMGLVTEEGAG